jgi:uncharacterized protein (DUF2384 family)
VEVTRRLKLTTSDVARVIGVSEPNASRLIDGAYLLSEGTKPWKMAALYVRFYRGLVSIVGDSDDLARDWLNSPNRTFAEQLPIDVIKQAAGLVQACEYVDAHCSTV